MKKILLFAIFATLYLTKIQCQTTSDEYNYITKGYKGIIENGYDTKKGYEFQYINTQKTTQSTAELYVLYRVKEDSAKEIAAYMVIYQLINQPKEYICIPHPKSEKEITDKYWYQLYDGKTNSSEKLQLILFLVSDKLKWQI